jgi:transcriptional regulator with XRE-family HTH domain
MPKGISDLRYRRLLGRLVEARKEMKLSQGEVAARLGRPQQFVSRYELGGRRLDVIEYVDVALALDLNPIDVLETVLKEGNA